MPAGLPARLARRIADDGPLGFDQWMQAAVYDPADGFYTSGAGAAGGNRGDFLTSPEVGPLFGAVLSRALDGWWRELGSPEPFTVIEAAAGRGALARAVAAAAPEWLAVADWVMVEPSAPLRAAATDLLGAGAGSPFRAVASLADAPSGVAGVVLANELLDNLPVVLLERTGDGWVELRVGGDAPRADGAPAFTFVAVAASAERAARADRLVPDAAAGTRLPLAEAARAWVSDALGHLTRGHLLLIDYARPTAELAAAGWDGWLRTYRTHERAGGPLDDPGTKDVTCDVPLDQLDAPAPDEAISQADLLARHGIDDLVAEGRRIWHERAHIGDLPALRARSRVREAEALCDPSGLGGFSALHWTVPGPGVS